MTSRRWWNGRWGRLSRRDVFVFWASGCWSVELRRGGEGGRSRSRTFESEAGALAWVATVLLESDGGWREVDAPRSPQVATSAGVVT